MGKIVNGSHTHEKGNDNHKMSNGIGWYNTQALPDGKHNFVAPASGTTGESWTPGIGGKGVMMGRTIVLPVGQYTLSFEAFGTTASNATDKTASAANDVVAFCTSMADVDITNTTLGGNTFHNVSFNLNVVVPNTTIEFGIKKVADASKAEWCQIKNVALTLNSSDIVSIPNNSVEGWTREPDSPENGTFKVNTWSTEGQSDATAFQVPFIESWVAKGKTLSDAVIKKSYTPTNSGIYKVTAWVRPKNESGGAISGVNMFAGDTKVDVCKSAIGTYTALVKAEAGVAFDYGFEIKDATFNWLSFKNIEIEYVGTGADDSDLTGAIVNNDFVGCENDKFPGWTITNPNGGHAWKNGNSNVEYWIDTAANGSFDYSQTITGLPNGMYKVSALMWNSMNDVAGTFSPAAGVYAKSGATTVWGLVDIDCDNGSMVEKESDVIAVTNGTLQLGVANKEKMSARWFGVDWIKLTFVKAMNLEDYRNNIAGLITQAEAITGKQTASVATALADAISAASGYEIETNIEALNGMIDCLTIAIENSNASISAYAALNTALNKDYLCDRSAAFTTAFTYRTEAQTMYSEATAATVDVQAKANGMLNAYRDYVREIAKAYPLALAAKAARENYAWDYTTNPSNNKALDKDANKDVDKNTLWENWKYGGLAKGDMKQTVNVPNGKYFLRMASFTRNSPNADDYIYIKSGSAEEKSVSLGDASTTNAFINITNPIEVTNGQVEIGLHVGSGADWAAIGGVELHVLSVDDYARATATEKYGTICLPYAATATGATVYSAAINGTTVELTEVGTDLDAGTPYIYQATADAQTFAYAFGNVVAEPVAAEPLVGVFTATTAPTDSYVMQTQNGAQKFYKATAGNEPTVGAYKAYISVPAASAKGSLSIGFADDNTTAVSAVNALIEGKAEIYTLGGVKLQKLQKGINIVNGVPVMVK